MSSVNLVSAGTVNVSTQAKYNLVLPVYLDGASTELQTDTNGILLVKDTAAGTSLSAIATSLSNIEGYVDGLEGFTDGLEALGTSLNGFVDELEGYTDGIEGLLTSGNADLASIAAEDFATEATLAAILADTAAMDTNLASIAAEDFATETTLAAILADTAAMDTNLASIAAEDFATETTLASILADTAAMDTNLASIAAEDFATETTLAAMSAKLPAALGQAASAASISVVIASDQSPVPVTIPYLSVVDQIDTTPGPVLDASVDTIEDNAGAFLEVVASLASDVKKIRIADTTGEFIGVYTGAASSEVLAFIINPGQDDAIEHSIASGTRISLRSMGTTDITTGLLVMQFQG